MIRLVYIVLGLLVCVGLEHERPTLHHELVLEVLAGLDLAGECLCFRFVDDLLVEHVKEVSQILLLDERRAEKFSIELSHLLLFTRVITFLEVFHEYFSVERVFARPLNGLVKVSKDALVQIEKHSADSFALLIIEDRLKESRVVFLSFALLQLFRKHLLGLRGDGRWELHERWQGLIIYLEVHLLEGGAGPDHLVEAAELAGYASHCILVVLLGAAMAAATVDPAIITWQLLLAHFTVLLVQLMIDLAQPEDLADLMQCLFSHGGRAGIALDRLGCRGACDGGSCLIQRHLVCVAVSVPQIHHNDVVDDIFAVL